MNMNGDLGLIELERRYENLQSCESFAQRNAEYIFNQMLERNLLIQNGGCVTEDEFADIKERRVMRWLKDALYNYYISIVSYILYRDRSCSRVTRGGVAIHYGRRDRNTDYK